MFLPLKTKGVFKYLQKKSRLKTMGGKRVEDSGNHEKFSDHFPEESAQEVANREIYLGGGDEKTFQQTL